eukprot:8966273-Pyramimonas_sp.AAC.3
MSLGLWDLSEAVLQNDSRKTYSPEVTAVPRTLNIDRELQLDNPHHLKGKIMKHICLRTEKMRRTVKRPLQRKFGASAHNEGAMFFVARTRRLRSPDRRPPDFSFCL